jgi:hypothetical protein
MENKELVEKLIEFFRTQDIELIYRLLANCMIDNNRWLNLNEFSTQERRSFIQRMKINDNEITKFAKYGPDKNIVLHYEGCFGKNCRLSQCE